MSLALLKTPSCRKAVFEALGFQALLLFLSGILLDGGATGQICFIALVAFWPGALMFVCRRRTLTCNDLSVLRIGYLPVVVIAWFLAPYIWRLRGAL